MGIVRIGWVRSLEYTRGGLYMKKLVYAFLVIAIISVVTAACPAFAWVQLKSDTEDYLRLRELLFCDMKLDSTLETLVTDDPGLALAISDMRVGKYETAKATIERSDIAEKLKWDPLYWFALAKLRRANGDVPGAKNAVWQILASDDSRNQIITWAILRDLGYQPNKNDAGRVLGVVVEMGIKEDYSCTLAGYTDGTTRLYIVVSGKLGGFLEDGNDTTRAAGKTLAATAQPVVSTIPVTTSKPLPSAGRIRFMILTPGGMHCADISEKDLQTPNHPLLPLYKSTQGLMDIMIKLIQASKQK